MLTLVEPQSSGIGGGAFILYWDARQRLLHAYDGRETLTYKKGNRGVRFIRHNAKKYDIDPNRIGIMGFSWGGVMSMLTATRKYAVQAEPGQRFAALVYLGVSRGW